MLDRISGLFRRGDGGKAGLPARPGTPPAVKTDGRETAKEPPAPAAEDLARHAEATRQLDENPSSSTALAIARGDFPAELRVRALGHVDDEDALLAVARDDRVARVRLAAAQRITRAESLESLRRDSQDKAVQRHVRDALKATREQEKAAQELRARIAHLLASAGQLAARPFEPLYDARIESLESSWREVSAHADAAQQERFAELAGVCRDTVSRHAGEIAARQQAIAATQELIAACGELETVAHRLRQEDLAADLPAVAALATTQQTRWQEAAEATTPDAPLAARFRAALAQLDAWLAAIAEIQVAGHDAAALLGEIAAQGDAQPDDEALDRWQDALDALRARIHWPDGMHEPALLATLSQAHRQLKSWRKARQAGLDQELAELRRKRHALRRMIDAGQLRAATRTHAWLLKRIVALPPRDAERERAALAAADESLKKLHDWYEFASVPKKIALCDRIESLLATPVEGIPARAETVRDLREQWNLLCAADPDADPELRARFDRAAQAAWAPCAAWYAEQHRIQDENLAKRAAICDALAGELSALDAGTPPDLKALDHRLRDVREAWKACEPVRWPEARALQDRFHELTGKLRGHLHAGREQHAGRKKELVAQAKMLLAHEPLEAAIAEAKRLQESWKTAGHADVRDERALWAEFRGALDAVFARREAARDADRRAREEAAAAVAREKAAEEERREARARERVAAKRAVIDAALAVADAESRWLAGGDVDTGAIEAMIDALPGKPALLPALRARVSRVAGGTRPDTRELDTTAQSLAAATLDIEILFDLPTPSDLSAERMQRRVALLGASLRGDRGNGRGGDERDPRTAALEAWLACGPVAGEARAPLQARIAQVLENAGR